MLAGLTAGVGHSSSSVTRVNIYIKMHGNHRQQTPGNKMLFRWIDFEAHQA